MDVLILDNKQAIEVLTDKNTHIGTTKCLDDTWEKLQPAIDLAVAALEKQVPKKPLQGEPFYWIDSVKVRGRYKDVRKKAYKHVCPTCGKNVAKLIDEHCSKCGQAIDWGD